MDDFRFDRVTRLFAQKNSRRHVIAALMAVMASRVISTGADAKPHCRQEDQPCKTNDQCCSGNCTKENKAGRSDCAPDPEVACDGFLCDALCCPPDAVGCAPIDLPDGSTKVTCQCARGFEYVNGACIELICPPGTNCSGHASCGDANTFDLCCQYPLTAYCTCNSPVSGLQESGCCTQGVDCPNDLGWDSWAVAGIGGPCIVGGIVICCCEGQECGWGGDVSLTCEEIED